MTSVHEQSWNELPDQGPRDMMELGVGFGLGGHCGVRDMGLE